MSNALKISQDESRHIGAILALQGYVKQCAEDGVWMTTINGEAVSDSKPPHFSLARVHKALADLQNRISSNNVDRKAELRVVQAVAFGDFLLERPAAQAADVGISIVSSKDTKNSVELERAFLIRSYRREFTRSPVATAGSAASHLHSSTELRTTKKAHSAFRERAAFRAARCKPSLPLV